LIPHADEECGYVLAVLPGFGERGAFAARFDSFGRDLDRHGEWLGVDGSDDASRHGFADVHVFDDTAAEVFETPKEGARTEEAAQASVTQGREGIGDRCSHVLNPRSGGGASQSPS
jgi:hypothetical protein